LTTRRVRRAFAENEDKDIAFCFQFYSISYDEIRNGGIEWKLNHQYSDDTIFFEIVPIGNDKYLGCLSSWIGGTHGIMSSNSDQLCDWIICRLDDKNRLIELDSGNWLNEDSSFFLDPTTNEYASKYNTLTHYANSSIVHTKNYLTICNLRTGRILVFSKQTGKLTRRIKLTEAVSQEQDSKTVCAVPITSIQPDLEDGLIVLARKDIDILESMNIIEKMNKAFLLEHSYELDHLFREFENDKQDAEWYRINLKNGKIEKNNTLDVPRIWNHSRFPPFFIPYYHGQILFGGIEKGFGELIKSIFYRHSLEKTEQNHANIR
jgi:hypothetical protein